MQTKVISGFPGVGKSSLFNDKNRGLVILDSDSSDWSWSDKKEKIRNPLWPENYIDHIRQNIGVADIICVSSHKEVRDAMYNNCIYFYLTYPGLDMKEEYIQRYITRGSPEAFVSLLRSNYEAWISELMKQTHCIHIPLKSGQYLSDVV